MSRTMAALTISFFILWLIVSTSCGSPAFPWAPTPAPPTADVPAVVQAAVATALAAQRARTPAAASPEPARVATPTAGREDWLRAGRGYFAVEAEALDLADLYDGLPSGRRAIGDAGTPLAVSALMCKQREAKLKESVYSLPLPPTEEGTSIRADVNNAFQSLSVYGDAVTKVIMAAPTVTPGSPSVHLSTVPGSDAVAASWESVRQKMLSILQRSGISNSEVGLGTLALPARTPLPASPPNTAVEPGPTDVRRLSSGAVLLSGSFTNTDKTWAMTDIDVVVALKDGTGKTVLEETAKLNMDRVQPGESAAWEYVTPASVKWETYDAHLEWGWQKP